jgi:bifunctional non-homologous end joining protein LigD
MTQLAAISQDPWFTRVESPHNADQCAIDLDPMPGVKFAAVLDVARWVRDELEKIKVTGFAKTSGASGLHIFVPLRQGTPYEAGQIFCEIVATVVAEKHPRVATVTRAVRARGQKVYVDHLQNIEGKSLACAYSARASDFAGASTPLTWKEIDEGVDPRDFTIRTLPDRLAKVGDLWAPMLRSAGVDLRRILKQP